jgi:hypothetical protein
MSFSRAIPGVQEILANTPAYLTARQKSERERVGFATPASCYLFFAYPRSGNEPFCFLRECNPLSVVYFGAHFTVVDNNEKRVAEDRSFSALEGLHLRNVARRVPRSDAFDPTSPFDRSVVAGPADGRVVLSFHSCLTLTNGVLTGPGPSLRACFTARSSTVMRPDPSP